MLMSRFTYESFQMLFEIWMLLALAFELKACSSVLVRLDEYLPAWIF